MPLAQKTAIDFGERADYPLTMFLPRGTINKTLIERVRSVKNIRHFIWDFDGTLFDTYPAIIQDLRFALREYGCDCDPIEAMRLMLETTISETRDHYADVYGIGREALADAYSRYGRETIALLQAEPFAESREVLEHICAAGRYNYIFTNREGSEALLYLKKYGLDGCFRDIIGSESPNFAKKPAPDAVLYLLEKHNICPDEAVMVGDRDCDLGSGRNAGIRAAHLVCPSVPQTLKCDWRLTNLRDILALL